MLDSQEEKAKLFQEKSAMIRKEYIQKLKELHHQIENDCQLCRDSGVLIEKQLRAEMESKIQKLLEEINFS